VITLEEYFRKPHSDRQARNAQDLLERVNGLLDEAIKAGVYAEAADADTGSQISGSPLGDGDGGFRTPGSRTGASGSSHRQGLGVDVYDPGNKLDSWLTDHILKQHGLYREHPDHTKGWCHLTTRAPGSGNRTFIP
jgi:hypothetical protein